MPLRTLYMSGTFVSDLSSLKGMQLQEKIQIGRTGVTELAPLAGMPLKSIDIGVLAVTDLSPLQGMKLTNLYASFNSNLRDISVFCGMPLNSLGLALTSVSDIAPLHGMSLATLDIRETNIADLSPLKDMPLRDLTFDIRYYDPQLAMLQSLPCTHINYEPASDFWQKFAAKRQAAEQFATEAGKLPPEELEAAIKKRLEEFNPGKIIDFFSLTTTDPPNVRLFNRDPNLATQFDDISPLMAIPKRSKLTLLGGMPQLDLSPLVKTEIEELICSEEQAISNRTVLAASKSLKLINGQPATDYLRKRNDQLDPEAIRTTLVAPEKSTLLIRDGNVTGE